jgi:hypothetical protein
MAAGKPSQDSDCGRALVEAIIETMEIKMTNFTAKRILILTGISCLVGCSRTESSNMATRMNRQVEQWIPSGTSSSQIRHTMEQHQFSCADGSYNSRAEMPQGSDPLWWDIGYVRRGSKTVSVTNVSILTCKRNDTNGDVWAYEARLTLVDGEFDGRYSMAARRMK